MKKLAAMVAVIMIGIVVAGCYPKNCERPQPMPYSASIKGN